MDRWLETELFVRTAELGSLSKAGDSLGLSTSSASRYLASLEARLGARLIERSTRRRALTEIGEAYLQRCKAVIADLGDADAMVAAATRTPSGTLKITSSSTLCQHHIAPLLPAYSRRYPEVRFQIDMSNRYPDLLASGMDLAIRTREFEDDSNIVVRRLGAVDRPVVASAGYLQAFGTPQTPRDLLRHRLLLYSYATRPHELVLSNARGDTETLAATPFLESNDTQTLRAAALAGLGIMVQPAFAVQDDIAAGRLVHVLRGWSLPRLTINLAYPSRRHMSAKVKTFADFIAQHFQEESAAKGWSAAP